MKKIMLALCSVLLVISSGCKEKKTVENKGKSVKKTEIVNKKLVALPKLLPP